MAASYIASLAAAAKWTRRGSPTLRFLRGIDPILLNAVCRLFYLAKNEQVEPIASPSPSDASPAPKKQATTPLSVKTSKKIYKAPAKAKPSSPLLDSRIVLPFSQDVVFLPSRDELLAINAVFVPEAKVLVAIINTEIRRQKGLDPIEYEDSTAWAAVPPDELSDLSDLHYEESRRFAKKSPAKHKQPEARAAPAEPRTGHTMCQSNEALLKRVMAVINLDLNADEAEPRDLLYDNHQKKWEKEVWLFMSCSCLHEFLGGRKCAAALGRGHKVLPSTGV
jgi:hypothetical protein